MKRIVSTGYVLANIIEDEYEGNQYKALELKVSDKTTERVKLKAPASYELLEMLFMKQNKDSKQ